MLRGNLTYILATLAILGAGAGYLMGIIETEQAVTMAWAGLAAFGLRRAIK